MPRFKKKILDPNTYRVNGEDVNLDKTTFRRWVNNFRKLKDSGYRLPAPFYHEKEAVPVRLEANKKDVDAYNNGGFWDRLWVAKRDGALWGEVDVPDEVKAKKIELGEIKEVSPAVRQTFETAEGKTLKDVVTHIAMVTQPVAGNQEPFEIAAAQCFARSLSSTEEQSGDSWDFQAMGEKPDVKQLNAGDADLVDVLEVLAEMGLVLPQDTIESNFAERVTTAALALRGKGVGQMKEQKTPPHQTVAYSQDLIDEEPDMAEEKEKKEAKEVTPSPEQVEMARNYEATKKFAEKVATDSLVRRIDALELPKEFKEKHITPLVEGHELQFSREGEVVPGTLDVVLGILEDLPKPAEEPKSPFFMSRMVPATGEGQIEEPPAEPKGGPQSDEEVDELIARVPALKSRIVSS